MKRNRSSVPAAIFGALLASAAVMQPAGQALAQDDQFFYFGVNMFSENVPGGGAGDDATGDFSGELDLTQGQICYYVETFDFSGANGAFIHEGKAGENGSELLHLQMPANTDDETCVSADPALLRRIAASPDDYYVAVRTPVHPNGAIRGQFSD